MLAAGQHERLITLLSHCPYRFWGYRRWAVRALIAQGQPEEALALAEATQGPNEPLGLIAQTCEAILLSLGRTEEAYRRHAIAANTATTYLATYRNICRKYPEMDPQEILADLVSSNPGQEGKWFAAATDAGQFDLALDRARKSPVDHRALIRAAKDFSVKQPSFAIQCGLLAIYWIAAGRAYDVTATDVLTAYELITNAAERLNCFDTVRGDLLRMLEAFPNEKFVRALLEKLL